MSHYLCRSLPFNLRRLTLQYVLNDTHFYSPSFVVLSARNASRFRGKQGDDNGGDRRRGKEHGRGKHQRFSGIVFFIKLQISSSTNLLIWMRFSSFLVLTQTAEIFSGAIIFF